MIKVGDKIKLTKELPSYEKGDIAEVTKIREGKSFKYELDDGEDLVSEYIVFDYKCKCGGKKVYSKSKGRVCVWCEL